MFKIKGEPCNKFAVDVGINMVFKIGDKEQQIPYLAPGVQEAESEEFFILSHHNSYSPDSWERGKITILIHCADLARRDLRKGFVFFQNELHGLRPEMIGQICEGREFPPTEAHWELSPPLQISEVKNV